MTQWWQRDYLLQNAYKQPWQWTSNEVARWVHVVDDEATGVSQFFAEQMIDGPRLLQMDHPQLAIVGLDSAGQRTKLLDEIAYLVKWGPSKHIHRYVTGNDLQVRWWWWWWLVVVVGAAGAAAAAVFATAGAAPAAAVAAACC